MFARLGPAAVGATLVVLAGACSSTGHSAGPTPSTTSTTTPGSTTTSTTPPTTVYAPSAPQTSPDAAANLLVESWSEGNRSRAASVAAPAAVAALFAISYPGSALALDRGCGDQPVVCTFGPNGGANPNDAIYELYTSQVANGWYVSSVVEEG